VPFALEDDVARAISARFLDHQSLRLAREAVTETGIANLDAVQIPRAEEVRSCLIGDSLRGPRIVHQRTERLHQFVDIARSAGRGVSACRMPVSLPFFLPVPILAVRTSSLVGGQPTEAGRTRG
jgi:hypothetical protein